MDQHREKKYLPIEHKGMRKLRILVAPLDWGLGHATRCIPVIKELLGQECDVWLAGEGSQQNLLQQEFPNLPFLALDGYKIKYSRSSIGMMGRIFLQINNILKAIKRENAWLKKQVEEYEFDAVISDNRYGLYYPSIPCIFITHQLQIKSPLGKLTEKILQKWNYRFINRFAECWVPDEERGNSLAGELSQPEKKPAVPVKYIGSLSRFNRLKTVEKKGHLLIILSGPEPQRSILENKIIDEVSQYNGTATVVRGLPDSSFFIPSTNMIRFYNHLPAEDMGKEMGQAEYVISRCGYSTVMDLVQLQKKSILIPTPGQTEQEYLANYLSRKQIICSIPQKGFSLTAALQKAAQTSYKFPSVSNESKLERIIAEFVQTFTGSK
jgi:uncharacterized protein (TIGR00661 family)